ncbi:gamma-glutamyl-gamma-aminobutyrate hydrolase [Carbonactinospora thermoautotrophica]|nr:gamma-glutamyl-gamma-aminobutyrate hydrolase [Carbonactinospora thermoautotrophica]
MLRRSPVRPVVAISTYLEQARWEEWDLPAALLPAAYAEAVRRSGGLPVLLPPGEAAGTAPDAAGEVLSRVDGLLIAGGADVDPARYGAEPHPRTVAVRPDRDHWETALIREALRQDLPLLGVCRGMQLLNVVLGGTLVQHLPDRVGHHGHAPAPGVFGEHPVELAAGSRLGELLGTKLDGVPTCHHQAVDRLGEGVIAVGWAPDGTVEAIEVPRYGFALGVQWHPEMGDDRAVFAALVERAARRARG